MREPSKEELYQRIQLLEDKLKTAILMLRYNIDHDEDCADKDEHFEEHECCECGASSIIQFVKEFDELGFY